MAKDLSNKKFGRLTPIEVVGKTKNRSNIWKCVCDCGKEKEISTSSLTRKKRPTQSCGCLRLDRIRESKPWNIKEKGDANSWAIYLSYKRASKKREIEFNIDYEFFKELASKNCHYCNVKPSQKCQKPQTNGPFIYNGLDRVDSNLGYKIDNVVPCCKDCNYAKRVMSVEDFKGWVSRVYEFFIKKS